MDLSLQLPINRPYRWPLFFIVWAACIFATVAVIPYSLALQSQNLTAQNLPIPLWSLLVVQVGQNAMLFGLAIAAGLWLAAKVGLGLPFLEAWLNGQPLWHKLPRVALLAAVLGVAGALLVILLDGTVFAAAMQDVIAQSGIDTSGETLQPAWWKGLLASFYGGIAEEVLLRLFLMTLLTWLGRFISKTPAGRATTPVLWIANLLAAVLFGLGHLPSAAAMGLPITAMFVLRTVVLNSLIGIIAGWLYWTRGLESAMISHFAADIVLHVIPPLLG